MATERHDHRKPMRMPSIRRSAILEITLFLSSALAVDILFFDGNRYWDVAPHPFWLIVLLTSVQYGTREGLVATVFSSAALLVGNIPSHPLTQDTYEYLIGMVSNPLMWFLANLVLGELRMRQLRERERLRESLSDAVQREETVKASHHRLHQAKNRLEVRMVSQMRSAMNAYQAARAIEKLEPENVLAGVADVVKTVINPEKFSLFLLDEEGLQLSSEGGWQPEDKFSRSFTPDSELYQEVVGRQRIVCCANPDDEDVLRGEGILAGPLLSATSGELVGMLKVENLDFLELNISNVEAFKAICEWIGTSYANARRYQAAKAESLVNAETKLFSYGFFERQTRFMTALARRFGFDLSLLVLRLENQHEIEPERFKLIPLSLGHVVCNELRRTDLVFDYQRSGSEFALILPGNSVENTQVLVDKLLDRLRMEIGEARLSATTLSLHQAQSYPGEEPFTQELFSMFNERSTGATVH